MIVQDTGEINPWFNKCITISFVLFQPNIFQRTLASLAYFSDSLLMRLLTTLGSEGVYFSSLVIFVPCKPSPAISPF